MWLLDGYRLRRPTREDVQAVTDFLNAYEVADGAEPEWVTDEVLDDWDAMDLNADAWLIEGPDGELTGYAYVKQLKDERYLADLFLLPPHVTEPVWLGLVRWAESRIAELNPAAMVVIHLSTNQETLGRLTVGEGYELVRHFLRMAIDLTEPPVPVFPPGVTVRTFRPEHDLQAAFDAKEEAFSDHWGHLPDSIERFAEQLKSRIFDPSLWFLAEAGGEVAGVSLALPMLNKGWVRTLGVRRAWRRQGLAPALLQHTFAEFFRRGVTRVELGVDAGSLTGATRLYEKAGMRVARTIGRYQKHLK